MPFYDKGDVRIHYEEGGAGFPLLVIPGGGLNSTVAGLATHPFNPFDEFQGEFRVIAADLRNAKGGQSTGPLDVDRPWDAYTDDLLTRKKQGAWEIGITTRWHEDDVAGRILPEGYNGESGDIACRDEHARHLQAGGSIGHGGEELKDLIDVLIREIRDARGIGSPRKGRHVAARVA